MMASIPRGCFAGLSGVVIGSSPPLGLFSPPLGVALKAKNGTQFARVSYPWGLVVGAARVSYLGGLLVGDDALRALYGHEWISAIVEGGTQGMCSGTTGAFLVLLGLKGIEARAAMKDGGAETGVLVPWRCSSGVSVMGVGAAPGRVTDLVRLLASYRVMEDENHGVVSAVVAREKWFACGQVFGFGHTRGVGRLGSGCSGVVKVKYGVFDKIVEMIVGRIVQLNPAII